MKQFDQIDEALAFLETKQSTKSQSQSQDDELLERTGIFTGLDPSSEGGLRRAFSLSNEKRQVQTRCKETLAKTTSDSANSGLSHATLLHSTAYNQHNAPPLTPPPESATTFNVGSIQAMSRSASLLPVRNLALSTSFYNQVLGFNRVSHTEGVQAIFVSGAACICLRAAEYGPSARLPISHNRMSSTPTRATSFASDASCSSSRNTLSVTSKEPTQQTETLAKDAANAAPGSTFPSTTSTSTSTTATSTFTATPPPISPTRPSASKENPTVKPSSPLPPPSPTAPLPMSGISVLLEHDGCFDSLYTLVKAKLNNWVLENRPTNMEGGKPNDARILGRVEETAWGLQELHLCDPDGYRILTTPLNSLFQRPSE